jgi:hypothetical protein
MYRIGHTAKVTEAQRVCVYDAPVRVVSASSRSCDACSRWWKCLDACQHVATVMQHHAASVQLIEPIASCTSASQASQITSASPRRCAPRMVSWLKLTFASWLKLGGSMSMGTNGPLVGPSI